jgi:hypothetical protein
MWSTPDLSDITQVLKGLVETALNRSALSVSNIKVYCDSPDTARVTDGFCHLTLYLLHVGRDPFWRNTPVSGPRPQLNTAQPLSLNLSYLLTAWCDKDFTSEQRAMSIALQAIHSTPIVTQTLIVSEHLQQWLPQGEFVISIEADTIDEMSRLWQAFTVPMRLSALIRASVVFIAPIAPLAPLAIPPSVANVEVSPDPVTATAPSLVSGSGLQSPPIPPSADPSEISSTSGPLIAVGGSTLAIAGNGLDLATAAEVFLSVPGTATEWNVTTPWRQGTPQPGELDIALPSGYVDPTSSLPAPPAATPLPGLYNVTVGSGAARSNPIPLVIAPRVDGVTNPPLLAPNSGGLYSITGAGFIPSAATTLTLGTVPLTYTSAATPAPGNYNVNAAGTGVSFVLPGVIAAGSYPVLLAVNGVAATAGWVVVVS